MEIRRAQPSEAAILSRIAQTAKAHWGYPETWLKQWQEQLTITPDFLARNESFSAIVDGRIVGFYSLLQTKDEIRLEHLWLLPEVMGRGLGRVLFQHAAARAVALGTFSLTIEADPNAEPFYLHLGAVRIGSCRSEVEGEMRELPLLTFDCRGRG